MVKDFIDKVKLVKNSSYKFATADTELKNTILKEIKLQLIKRKTEIFSSNQTDINLAIKKGLTKAIIDRLTLTENRFDEMLKGIDTVISLEDPVNKIIEKWERPEGFEIRRYRVPLGVIFVIYESRPNVTIDSVVLCIKSGNCVILRGGSEAINTNKMLVEAVRFAVDKVLTEKKSELMRDIILFIDNPDYTIMYELLKLENFIDLVIPRGSDEMVSNIKKHSLIPVLSHGSGVCHIYVDEFADIDKSLKVCYNAKVQRPSVCNAIETLLVHKNIAEKFLPLMAKKFVESKVELRSCNKSKELLEKFGFKVGLATEDDWYKEYLDLIISIKIVDDIQSAIDHINKYGSHHSDGIMTENEKNKEKFINEVDSSAVFINSSTRLHDGGVFGFGTEIGISTSKIHARGTMGLRELTTTKYVVVGDGHIRT